jgi:hypothetical protein
MLFCFTPALGDKMNYEKKNITGGVLKKINHRGKTKLANFAGVKTY